MASTSDKPVHAPSEKHTLDEVLKSLQDLVRNDLNSVPTAPAKSRIKAGKIAADEPYHAGEVIDELAASLAVLAHQEQDTAPPDETSPPAPSSAAPAELEPSPGGQTTLETTTENIDSAPPADVAPSVSETTPEPVTPMLEITAKAADDTAVPPEPSAPEAAAALDEETIDFGDETPGDAGLPAESSTPILATASDEPTPPTASSDAEPISPSHDSESAMIDRPSDVPDPSADEPRAEILSSDELESPNMELESIAIDLGDLGETIAPVAATDSASSDDAMMPVSDFEAPSNELDFLPAIDIDESAADTPAVDRSPQSAEAEHAARAAAPELPAGGAPAADQRAAAKSAPDTSAAKVAAPDRAERSPDKGGLTSTPKPVKTSSAGGSKRAITGGVQQALPLAETSPTDARTAANAARTPTIPLSTLPDDADGQAATDSEWDDIPILENAVDLKSAGEGSVVLTAEQARRAVIKVVARLNVELRRAGKRSLNTAVITRLAQLLQEELAPARANVDNKPAKKR